MATILHQCELDLEKLTHRVNEAGVVGKLPGMSDVCMVSLHGTR